jgi:hypothetical protein
MSVSNDVAKITSDLIFSQTGEQGLAVLADHALRYFDAHLRLTFDDLPAYGNRSLKSGNSASILFQIAKQRSEHRFLLHTRTAEPPDYDAAEAAERRGSSTGMSALARRCQTVWCLEALGEPVPAARYLLWATLASCALGPVMPADGGTLLGVRSARLLAESELGTARLSRKP